jgi:hypothetical protein
MSFCIHSNQVLAPVSAPVSKLSKEKTSHYREYCNICTPETACEEHANEDIGDDGDDDEELVEQPYVQSNTELKGGLMIISPQYITSGDGQGNSSSKNMGIISNLGSPDCF